LKDGEQAILVQGEIEDAPISNLAAGRHFVAVGDFFGACST